MARAPITRRRRRRPLGKPVRGRPSTKWRWIWGSSVSGCRSCRLDDLIDEVVEAFTCEVAGLGEEELVGPDDDRSDVPDGHAVDDRPGVGEPEGPAQCGHGISEPSNATSTRRAGRTGAARGMMAVGTGACVAHCVLVDPSTSRLNPPSPREPRISIAASCAASISTDDVDPSRTSVSTSIASSDELASGSIPSSLRTRPAVASAGARGLFDDADVPCRGRWPHRSERRHGRDVPCGGDSDRVGTTGSMFDSPCGGVLSAVGAV